MPYRTYHHACCSHLPEKAAASLRCPSCGTPGTLQGWAPTRRERELRFPDTSGLQAAGEHLDLVREFLSPLRTACPDCRGSGYLGRERPARCPLCEGTGGFWTGSEEALTAAYREILRRHPLAASWQPGALTPFRLGVEESEVER